MSVLLIKDTAIHVTYMTCNDIHYRIEKYIIGRA